MFTAACTIPVDIPPFRLSGVVYGALLNQRGALDEIAALAGNPPYGALPRAPVLQIKPRNTLAGPGAVVQIPPGVTDLEIGANLGLVIGRPACRVGADEALDFVAGYLIVNDIGIAHDSFHRPAIRLKARDGFCPLGPAVVARSAIPDPDALRIRTYADGVLVQDWNTADLVRSTSRLLADVTEFMTLAPGDILAVGAARPSPRARAGQRVEITIDGVGTLSSSFAAAPS